MNKISEYICSLNNQISQDGEISEEILYNTKLLLSLYRKVLTRVNKKLHYMDMEALELEHRHLYELVDALIDVDTQIKKSRFESRMQSIEESISILKLMDMALWLVREDCVNGENYYLILYHYFFGESPKTHEEIMRIVHMSNTTYYRHKKQAIREFAVNLWGYTIPKLYVSKRE